MMTVEQLTQHHAQIYQVLAHEIRSKQTKGDTMTLEQLEAAMDSLNAIKDELEPLLAGRAKGHTQLRLVDTREEYRYR